MRELLTKYECSRIIGIRACQLSMSSQILVDVPPDQEKNFLYISALELKMRKLDIVIRRPLPMNRFYEINISEMDLPDDIDALLALYDQRDVAA